MEELKKFNDLIHPLDLGKVAHVAKVSDRKVSKYT